MSDRNPFVGARTDRSHSAYLGDVGGGLESYAVTTEISSDGCTIGFWIEDRSTPDFRCTAGWKTVPEHEQVGPLPDRWKYRIELAQTNRHGQGVHPWARLHWQYAQRRAERGHRDRLGPPGGQRCRHTVPEEGR